MILSIIIPVYNAENTIERCIRSIVNQPVSTADYEIICVDDCSRDCSCDIISQLSQEIENLVLIKHSRNMRQGAARNTGLDRARGNFVWFVDDDDVIADGFLQKIYDQKIINNDVDFFQFNALVVESDGMTTCPDYLNEELRMPGLDYLEYEATIGYKKRIVATWSKWFRKDFLLQNKLKYNEDGLFVDVMHTFTSYYLANCVVYLPECGYCYIQTPDSIMRSRETGWKFADTIRFCIDMADFIGKHGELSPCLVEFTLSKYDKVLRKYKRNLHKLSLIELEIFSAKIAAMDISILSKYYNDTGWISNRFVRVLIWLLSCRACAK